MLIQALIIALTAGAVICLMEVRMRCRASELFSRALDCALHPERYASESRLEPESRFVVRLSDSAVVCERPDGKTERVGWAHLQKVEVDTTSDGPLAPDVFWVLHGADGDCIVPQGANGERDLFERLQALPWFDHQAFSEAMCSTSDRTFLCWQRAA